MIAPIIILAAVLVVGLLVLRRGRDRRAPRLRTARRWRIAGLAPLGLQAALFLLLGLGEMLSGDLSGAAHLLQLVVVVLCGLLGWLRPLETGFSLLVAGVFTAAGMLLPLLTPNSIYKLDDLLSPALILGLPLVLSGLSFLIGGLPARAAPPPAAE